MQIDQRGLERYEPVSQQLGEDFGSANLGGDGISGGWRKG